MRKRSEGGFTLILGMLSLLFIIPVIGLAIDVGFLYISKSKLQAAVDGAALAAARSLNIGQSTSSQAAAGQANAVNWFYANFPNNFFGSSGTVMNTSTVTVTDDPNNAHLRDVQVTATTNVSTVFMRWLGFTSTTVGALGKATRRDVVIMMVLDRSASMCAGGSSPCTETSSTPCATMISSAKLFTGQFAEGRDSIGLVTFADSSYIHSTPTTSFQSVLGYSNDQGSGTGALDNISCWGGTGTAQGVSLGYQLLYQTGEAGALNVLFLETDGLPNSLTMNFYDSTNNQVGLTSTSSCQDTNNKTVAQGGFGSSTVIPHWTGGLSVTTSPFLTTSGYYSNIPAGMIGTVDSSDPGSTYFWVMDNYWTTTGQTQSTGSSSNPYNGYPNGITTSTAKGCYFASQDLEYDTNPKDIAWFPATDAWGNKMNPSNPYASVTTDSHGHVLQNGWQNYQNAVLNTTDNAAYVARSNSTIGAYFFVIGLGGNSSTGPPDPILLQRMANDPNGDTFNTAGPDDGGYYWPCSQESTCVNYPSQPQGTFIYSSNSTTLAEAFLRISSQVLRLSK